MFGSRNLIAYALSRRATIVHVLLLLLAGIPIGHASGQSRDAEAVIRRAIASNWTVRASRERDSALTGRLRLYADSSVLIGSERVTLADLSALDRQYRVGGASMPGVLAGGIAGGLVFHGLSGICDGGPSCAGKSIATTAGGVLLGAVLGGFIGAVLAPGRIEWERVWTRSRS
jgi:hypothetical protein